MPVQQQTNSVDCGIFAMAFLTCILSDEDPKTQRFDEKLFAGKIITDVSRTTHKVFYNYWKWGSEM